MSDHHEAVPDPSARCRHLRSKMMHVASDWEQRASEYPSTTSSYWCLKTMGSVGPDDFPAELDSCRAGRTCFEAID